MLGSIIFINDTLDEVMDTRPLRFTLGQKRKTENWDYNWKLKEGALPRNWKKRSDQEIKVEYQIR